MKKYLLSLLLSTFLTSCGTSGLFTTSKQAFYHVVMTSVESPKDAKTTFGETEITKLTGTNGEGKQIENFLFKDDYVEFYWYVGLTQLEFTMKNNSGHTITINWDEISYVDIWGDVSRIMHNGVKYIEREKPQGSVSVPNAARISDALTPNSNVYYVQGSYGGWRQKALIPCFYDTEEQMQADIAKGAHIGKKFRVLFPIYIEGVKNDYVFEFTAEQILNGTAEEH